MRRLWLGIGLLVILLILGICATVMVHSFHLSLSRQLAQAGSAAQAGDWEQAHLLISQARSSWTTHRNAIAAAVNHEPMEEIEEYFANLMVYYQQRDRLGVNLCCAALSAITEALGESQSINWWSLL